MGEAAVEPVDTAGQRIAEQEIGNHRRRVELEGAKRLPGDDLGLAQQFGNGNDRGDGTVLDGEYAQGPQRWQHANERLRQDDGAHSLEAAHAESQGSVHLRLTDGGQTGPDGLGHVGAKVNAKPGYTRGEGVDRA